MSLYEKITVACKDLDRHQNELDLARVSCAELAPFATPADVARTFETRSFAAEDRYALVGAIVVRYGNTTHPLWASLLYRAFTPMLLRIRTRMGWPECEDRDQRVLLAFLEAIGRPSVQAAEEHAAIAIERATRKALTHARLTEKEEPELVSFDDAGHWDGDMSAVALAELRAEAAWAERRAARAVAHIGWVRARSAQKKRAA